MAEYRLAVRDWPASEQPREKLQQFGPGSLSNAELIAILLRVGSVGEDVVSLSQRLLVQYGGLAGLHQAIFATLAAEHGMGQAKTSALKAALELGRRLLLDPGQERMRISSPDDVAQLLMMEMHNLEQECLRTVLLNTKNMVLAAPTIYQGSVNSTSFRVGELFREAVRHNATALILVHNHPSGDPTPSPEDVQVTRTLVEAGKMMDIEVLDHLVIGRGKYVSLKERRLGF
ncbi:MAG: repair protein RadC [Chloroflexi bacterium]|nr:repair protein RadC [Chloroflexota bacterium]MDB5076916.1 repair protein RadC [Chloroflexota bacterium]